MTTDTQEPTNCATCGSDKIEEVFSDGMGCMVWICHGCGGRDDDGG